MFGELVAFISFASLQLKLKDSEKKELLKASSTREIKSIHPSVMKEEMQETVQIIVSLKFISLSID
jgi:hypothetical protein